MDKEEILHAIIEMIKPELIENSEIYIKKNLSNYDSIVVKSLKTPYRSSDTGELLFARLKTSGGSQYISFNEKYHTLFESKGIGYSQTKSNKAFIRLNLDIFSPLGGYPDGLTDIINKIFIDVFSFPSFGCCGKYIECSDIRHCVHDDRAYATACQYRKALEDGKIFYGKNRNIDE